MNNTLYLDYMTRTYSNILKSAGSVGREKRPQGFQEQVVDRFKESGQLLEIEESEQPQSSTETMSLEEYKQYIYDKISALPTHPSQDWRSVMVFISDEGFQAMQQDPEYEKWVLDVLRRDFAFNDVFSSYSGGSYTIHIFGATKEEYRGESWHRESDYERRRAEREAKDTYWERRARRKKRLMEEYKILQARKLRQEKMEAKMYEEELHSRHVAEMKRIRGEMVWGYERHLEQVSMSYETSILMDLLGGGIV